MFKQLELNNCTFSQLYTLCYLNEMKTRFTNLHARPAVLVPSIIENMLHDHN